MSKENAVKASDSSQLTSEVSKKESLKDAKGKKPDNKGKDTKKKDGFFKKVTRFFKDTRSEFKKIIWPTRKQIINNTTVVLVVMAIVGVSIWILDWLFINLFTLMY